jgi:hypothetical protein
MQKTLKMQIPETICEIICSEDFKEKLDFICVNYSNLKQESHIRNAILELFNEKNKEDYRAFAEHPRKNGLRVDLSIAPIKSNKEEKIFTIEFKYNFPKDADSFKTYDKIINNDFNRDVVAGVYKNRENLLNIFSDQLFEGDIKCLNFTSMFILIVAQWETETESKKSIFDKSWGITSKLSRFVDNNDRRLNNIRFWFNYYKNKEHAFAYEIDPIFTETLDTKYSFFILSREEFDNGKLKNCHTILPVVQLV